MRIRCEVVRSNLGFHAKNQDLGKFALDRKHFDASIIQSRIRLLQQFSITAFSFGGPWKFMTTVITLRYITLTARYSYPVNLQAPKT